MNKPDWLGSIDGWDWLSMVVLYKRLLVCATTGWGGTYCGLLSTRSNKSLDAFIGGYKIEGWVDCELLSIMSKRSWFPFGTSTGWF